MQKRKLSACVLEKSVQLSLLYGFVFKFCNWFSLTILTNASFLSIYFQIWRNLVKWHILSRRKEVALCFITMENDLRVMACLLIQQTGDVAIFAINAVQEPSPKISMAKRVYASQIQLTHAHQSGSGLTSWIPTNNLIKIDNIHFSARFFKKKLNKIVT